MVSKPYLPVINLNLQKTDITACYYDELNHLHCFAIKKVIFIGLYGVVYISERLNPLLSPSTTLLYAPGRC